MHFFKHMVRGEIGEQSLPLRGHVASIYRTAGLLFLGKEGRRLMP